MNLYDEWNVEKGAYDKDEAKVETHIVEDRNATGVQQFEEHFGAASHMLAASFRQYDQKKRHVERRVKSGRLNNQYVPYALTQVHSGYEPPENLYDRKVPTVETTKKIASVGLLLDQSGSTRFHVENDFRRIDLIKHTAIMLGRSLQTLDDAFFVYSFHSSEDTYPTIMEVCKTPDEHWSYKTEEKIASIKHTANTDYYNNADGSAIRFANEQLLRFNGPKYLFMVTDGNPNCDHTYYKDNYAHADTAKALEEGKEKGISNVYLTINPDSEAHEFMRKIKPHTVHQHQYKKMSDVVEGLTEVYEKIKLGKL